MWLREVVCVSDRRTCCFFCRSQPWVGPFDSCFRHHPIQRPSALERGRFFKIPKIRPKITTALAALLPVFGHAWIFVSAGFSLVTFKIRYAFGFQVMRGETFFPSTSIVSKTLSGRPKTTII